MKKILILLLALAGARALAQTGIADLVVARTIKLAGDISPSQITANTNDYAPTNFASATVLLVNSDTARNLTGLAGGADGRIILIYNTGSFTITLKNADAGSSAANRFDVGSDFPLASKTGALLSYDSVASRWRLVGARPAGTGDVVGPGSATDSRIVAFDTTTGKLIKDGGKTIAEINPVGPQTVWMPAAALVPATTNGAAPVQTELTAGHPEVVGLAFDASTEESAQFSIAMPKSWDNGTLTAVFYWEHPSTSTNFDVIWGIQALAASNTDAIDAAFGTAQTVTDTGGTTDHLYVTAATSAITVGGSPATGDIVFFRVYRKAADGSDTLAVDAKLIGVKLVYTVNAPTDT